MGKEGDIRGERASVGGGVKTRDKDESAHLDGTSGVLMQKGLRLSVVRFSY